MKNNNEYRICVLPHNNNLDFYTDGKGFIYIVERNCDFESRDEFIKLGKVKVNDNDFYPKHIKDSSAILEAPFYLIEVDNYNVFEINREN